MESLQSSLFTQFNRAFIVGGGPAPAQGWLRSQFLPGDCLIAADRGAAYLQADGLGPDLLLGDFDSLPPELLPTLQKSCRQCLAFPCDKDYSDLELALRAAHHLGFRHAIVAAALYGRLDHCLFNVISVLQLADELGLEASLVAPDCQIYQLQQKKRSWSGCQGKLLSLISLDEEAEVSLQGAKWPLVHSKLRRSSTRGLSNIVIADEVTLECHRGRIIVLLSDAEK